MFDSEPLLNLSRFLGTFPFDRNFEISKSILFRSIGLGSLSLVLCTLRLLQPPRVSVEYFYTDHWVLQSIHLIEPPFGTFLAIFTLFWLYRERNIFTSICIERKRVEKFFNSFQPIHKPKYLIVHYVIWCMLLFLITTYFALFLRSFRDLFNLIFFFIDKIILYSISDQFKELTSSLNRLYQVGSESLSVESAVRLHSILCLVQRAIHKIYGPLIFLVIARSFILIIIHTYLVVGLMPYDVPLSILNGFWLTFLVVPVVLFISASFETEKEVQRFNETLYWKVMEDKTGRLANNERVKLHFNARRHVKFSAAGFFPLNRSLIGSMIITGTTYLVILFQYGKGGFRTAESEAV